MRFRRARIRNFKLFFFCGFLPWLLFSDTVIRNCSAITDNAPLITKTIIPAEILPVSITISNLVHHLIGLAILIAALGFFYDVHLSALWILLYLPMLLMFAQGLGWIVAGLHVFVRDTIQGLEILLFLWLWFTPVFYSGDLGVDCSDVYWVLLHGRLRSSRFGKLDRGLQIGLEFLDRLPIILLTT